MPAQKMDRLFELLNAFSKPGVHVTADFDAAIGEGLKDFLKDMGYKEKKNKKQPVKKTKTRG